MTWRFISSTLVVVALAGLSCQSTENALPVGDGVADDTEALQSLIDAGIRQLRLRPGTYRIWRTLEVDLAKHGPISISGGGSATIVMEGPGPAIRIVGTHDGTAAPSTVRERIWTRERTPLIDALEIVGVHPEAHGIELVKTMQATLTRVTVRSARDGIRLVERNRNVIISECHVYDNRGVGILLDGVDLHQINITNCHVSYNGAGGIVVRNSEVRNLQIGSCDIEGNMIEGGPSAANILLDASSGSIREGAIVGCTIQHTHKAPDSANLRLIGRGSGDGNKVGIFSISDNAMSDVAVNIHLVDARGVTITGNTMWQGFEQNILVERSSNVVIGPNLCDRNPDYRPRESRNGIELRSSSDCTIQGLHIRDAHDVDAGIVLRMCSDTNVTGCTILDSGSGVLLDRCEFVRVSDCFVRERDKPEKKRASIRVVGGSGNWILDNLVDEPVDVDPASAAVVENNRRDDEL
jgi:hypothetical protein